MESKNNTREVRTIYGDRFKEIELHQNAATGKRDSIFTLPDEGLYNLLLREQVEKLCKNRSVAEVYRTLSQINEEV